MMLHEAFWSYKRFRYLKAALLLLGVTLVGYAAYSPIGGHNGGTWFGYLLGTVSFGIMIWLMWFGIRKRSYYKAPRAPLSAWLSAHTYLGLVLLVLVPLHSGFQLGWNVHTLAYVLMSLAILSGIVGVIFYSVIPGPMTENRPGQKIAGILQAIAEIDDEWAIRAQTLPNEIAHAVSLSINDTHIGGGLLLQLSGTDPNCGTRQAIKSIRKAAVDLGGSDLQGVEDVLEVLSRKSALLGMIRRDARWKALLDLWLLIHVPLAFATVVTVFIHVFVVFYYL
jgi:hypothetical protein